jgi:hypothetical protein
MKYHLNLPTWFESGNLLIENSWNFKLTLSKTLIIRVLLLVCSAAEFHRAGRLQIQH